MFLNVPYDRAYEPLFVALIAALVALGRKPHCTLELPDLGQGRPDRILALLEGCRISFHDLSRIGAPARFNMSFELGLAYALRRYRGSHDFVVLDRQPHRLGRTLSDMKTVDPLVHAARPRTLISCVLDVLGTTRRDPRPDDVYRLARELSRAAERLKQEYRRETIFHAAVYRRLLMAAADMAQSDFLIPSWGRVSEP